MPGLLDKRLIFVTGKGGVGRSTVAAALGLAAARRGLRTILAEVAGQDRVCRAFAREGVGFEETELADGLWAISIDPRHAIEEYLAIQLPVKPLADVLSGSRMFGYFAAATPGMSELLTMGKVWELAQLQRRTRRAAPYDLVILDAPATGHGLAVMRAPKTFADIARVGPIAHQGRTIHEMIVDSKRTGVVAVTLAQEMPVNETLSLRDSLRDDLGLGLDLVVLNGLYPDRFSARDATRLRRAASDGETAGTPLGRAAVRAAVSERIRVKEQQQQASRLERDLEAPAARLPFLFAPEVGLDGFEALSHELEAAL